MTSAVTVTAEDLKEFVSAILRASQMPDEKAALVAESLVAANLRGVDSHGVHLLPHYLKQIEHGNIDCRTDGHVVSEDGGCLLYDGEHGIGQCVSAICCRHAVRLAKEHGLGMVVARASNHFGAAAFWAQKLSAEGMIGFAFSNASPAVAPWQGRDGRVGTNPICMSIPSHGDGRWLLDMATTTVAMNRIVKAAANQDASIPTGWAMDSNGAPTTDTQTAMQGLLMPLGGYKGSGLGLMVEILCGVLGGGAMSTDVGGIHIVERPMSTSQTFLAIDVGRFLPEGEFDSRMQQLVRKVKSARSAHGFEEVLVAGEPEWRSEERRMRDGIPVDGVVWEKLREIALRLEVLPPKEIES